MNIFKKFFIIFGIATLMTGCAGKIEKDSEIKDSSVLNKEIIETEMYWIKLYTKDSVDTSEIFNFLNTELKTNNNMNEILSKYGTSFIETKLKINAVEKEKFEFTAGSTFAYVSGLIKNNLEIDYYKTGVNGDLTLSKIETGKYIVDFNLETTSLSKIETDPKNKIISYPLVQTKRFTQSLIMKKSDNIAVVVNNIEPKQYDIVILSIK
jgi:hypothetical protein